MEKGKPDLPKIQRALSLDSGDSESDAEDAGGQGMPDVAPLKRARSLDSEDESETERGGSNDNETAKRSRTQFGASREAARELNPNASPFVPSGTGHAEGGDEGEVDFGGVNSDANESDVEQDSDSDQDWRNDRQWRSRRRRGVLHERPTEATYLVQDNYTVDTRDYEDHTFNGVMFDMIINPEPPVKEIIVNSLWVRGRLGPMQVFTADDTFLGKEEHGEQWQNVHKATHPPSMDDLHELPLEPPVRMGPGSSRAFYVHSGARHDEGIVYNNQRGAVTHIDRHIKIMPGMAHLDVTPFGGEGRGWGAWRNGREFVGRVGYSCRWLLWNPEVHHKFPRPFRDMVMAMFMAHNRPESSISNIPYDTIFHILNMCAWDWGGLEAPPEPPQPEPRERRQQYLPRFLLRALANDGEGLVVENEDGEQQEIPLFMQQILLRRMLNAFERGEQEEDSSQDEEQQQRAGDGDENPEEQVEGTQGSNMQGDADAWMPADESS